MKILQIGNPILETKTKEVTKFKDPKIGRLIAQLESLVASDNESAGIAAPQIGESLAICVVKRIEDDEEDDGTAEIIPLINPKVISSSKETTTFWEGCLSVGIGEERLFGPVSRPSKVEIEYFDKNGNKKRLKASGYFSHFVQHEIDHLNGILFVKYVKNPENLWTNKDLDEYIEKYNAMPPVIDEHNLIPSLIID